MLAAFSACPEAISNTVDLAARCDLELTFGKYQFPIFATPANETLEEHLDRVAREGLETRLAVLRAQENWSAERPEVIRRYPVHVGVAVVTGLYGRNADSGRMILRTGVNSERGGDFRHFATLPAPECLREC